MKNTFKLLCFCILHSAFCLHASAQGTSFTYQGKLNDGANPATGFYDLRFTIYDSTKLPGAIVAGPLTNSATGVTSGLFTVTLDFGSGVFTGPDRWLDIAVRTNGVAAFSPLAPRQKMTAAPYAITAGNVTGVVPSAAVAGAYSSPVTFNNPANSFTGNGGGLTNVNALTLGGIGGNGFWRTAGNAGTAPGPNFLGTTDNQPLEFRANNHRAFRLELATVDANHAGVNLIGGAAVNYVAPGVIGATIAGGGTENFFLSPLSNSVSSFGSFATIGGGFQNVAAGFCNTVAGGRFNFTSDNDSTIGGGFDNTNTAFAATIPGGIHNLASGWYSFAAGNRAKAIHQGAFVWADSQDADFASTASDQFNIRAQGGVRLNADTSLYFGAGAKLWPDQGGSIELGNSLAGFAVPYIDFHYGVGASQDFNVRLINDADGQLTCTGNLGFGSQTRQMLKLWSTSYGIGVQAATEYFRTDSDFSWFKGGVHSDTTHDPGAGGTEMMRLDSAGNLKTLTGTISSLSDRNAKQKFEPVNSREVLDQVVALPLSRWSYKTDPASRHLGPMAQDFYAAFDVGLDDKSICTVDADGVALAAIQGLNQKVDELKAELNRAGAENAELKHRLDKLEQLLNSKHEGPR